MRKYLDADASFPPGIVRAQLRSSRVHSKDATTLMRPRLPDVRRAAVDRVVAGHPGERCCWLLVMRPGHSRVTSDQPHLRRERQPNSPSQVATKAKLFRR